MRKCSAERQCMWKGSCSEPPPEPCILLRYSLPFAASHQFQPERCADVVWRKPIRQLAAAAGRDTCGWRERDMGARPVRCYSVLRGMVCVWVCVCVWVGGGGKPTPKAAVGWTAQVYVVRRMQGAECVLAAAAAHRTDCLCWGKPAVHARSPPRGERRPLRVPGRERDTWMGASAREVATWTPDGAPGQLPAPSRSAGGMSARPCAANAKVMPCDGNTCLLFTAFS